MMKVVQTAIELEFYKYEGLQQGERRTVSKRRKYGISHLLQASLEDLIKIKEKNLLRSLYRTKTKLRRLINSNPDCNKFLTLTFADEVTDLQQANMIFNRFIKRLKYHCCKDLKYIAVPEFTKRGRVHYHVLYNAPFIDSNFMSSEIWRQGFVKIRQTDTVKNFGAYFTKYLTKDNFDDRFIGMRKFFCSQNCDREKISVGFYAKKVFDEISKLIKPHFERTFAENAFCGSVKYEVFDLIHATKWLNFDIASFQPFEHLTKYLIRV